MRRKWLAGLTALAAAAAWASPAAARTVAEDVAELSTNACFRLAAGTLTLPHPAAAEFEAAVRQLALEPGIIRSTMDRLGPAIRLISRSAMAHRVNGDHVLILSTDGALPGCRILLVGAPPADAIEAVAAALASPASGWTAFPALTETRGLTSKRVFLRRDAQGAPYLLNLVALGGVSGEMHLFTTTVRVPPGVTLPEGF